MICGSECANRDFDLLPVSCATIKVHQQHVLQVLPCMIFCRPGQERHCRQLGDIDEDDEPPIAEAVPTAGDVEDCHRQCMYRV